MAKYAIDKLYDPSVVPQLDEVNVKLDNTLAVIRELNTVGGGVKFVTSIKQAKEETKKYSTALTEAEKQERALRVTKERLAIANSQVSKELIKEREQLKQVNKESREAAKLTTRITNAYDQLVVELNAAKKEYLGLRIAAQRAGKDINSPEILKAKKNYLDLKRNADGAKKSISTAVQPTQRLTVAMKALQRATIFLGIAAGARELLEFTKASFRLSVEAEGIRKAFKNVEDGAEAVNAALKSTDGTIERLELERASVQFDNLGISQEILADGMALVAVRSQQTGEEIDKLREQMVLGLGRESAQRIDDLGVSQKELNSLIDQGATFAEAFATIAKREVAEAGDVFDTTKADIQRFNVALKNVKLTIGDELNKSFKDLKIGMVAIGQAMQELAEIFGLAGEEVDILKNGFEAFVKGLNVAPKAVIALAAVFNGFVSVLKATNDNLFDFLDNLQGIGNVDFSGPGAFFKSLKEIGTNNFDQFKELGANQGEAFNEGFQEVIRKSLLSRLNTDASVFDPTVTDTETGEGKEKEIKTTLELIEALRAEREERFKNFKTLQAISNPSEEVVAQIDAEREAIARLTEELAKYGGEILNANELKLEPIGVGLGSDIGIPLTEFQADLDKLGDIVAKGEKELTDIQKREARERKKLREEELEAAKEFAIQQAFALAGQGLDTIFDNKKTRIDEEKEQRLTAIDEEEQAQIALAQSQEEIEQIKSLAANKRRQEERNAKAREAKADKSKAVFETILNTASGIVEALPNIPLSIAVGAAGAIQLGIIQAQKIPKFRTGVKNKAKGGLGIVGDGGRELVDFPTGERMLFDKDTLLDLPKGTTVHTNRETEKILSLEGTERKLETLTRVMKHKRTVVNIYSDNENWVKKYG